MLRWCTVTNTHSLSICLPPSLPPLSVLLLRGTDKKFSALVHQNLATEEIPPRLLLSHAHTAFIYNPTLHNLSTWQRPSIKHLSGQELEIRIWGRFAACKCRTEIIRITDGDVRNDASVGKDPMSTVWRVTRKIMRWNPDNARSTAGTTKPVWNHRKIRGEFYDWKHQKPRAKRGVWEMKSAINKKKTTTKLFAY